MLVWWQACFWWEKACLWHVRGENSAGKLEAISQSLLPSPPLRGGLQRINDGTIVKITHSFLPFLPTRRISIHQTNYYLQLLLAQVKMNDWPSLQGTELGQALAFLNEKCRVFLQRCVLSVTFGKVANNTWRTKQRQRNMKLDLVEKRQAK